MSIRDRLRKALKVELQTPAQLAVSTGCNINNVRSELQKMYLAGELIVSPNPLDCFNKYRYALAPIPKRRLEVRFRGPPGFDGLERVARQAAQARSSSEASGLNLPSS